MGQTASDHCINIQHSKLQHGASPLSSLLFDNLRVRLNAAGTMGRAGQWTAQQNEHVAEATLAAFEDPIAGTDQKSEDNQLKMRKEFVGRDPQPIACGSLQAEKN
jgi:hypothetical protein